VLPLYYVLTLRDDPLVPSMGIFLPLIAADSLVAVRCERFILRQPYPGIKSCVVDAAGTAAGYALAAVAVGALREFFTQGSSDSVVRAARMPLGGLLLLSLLAFVWNLIHVWRVDLPPQSEADTRPAPKSVAREYHFEELGSTSYAVERPGQVSQGTGTFPKIRQTTGTFPRVTAHMPPPVTPPKVKRTKILSDFAAFKVVIPELEDALRTPPLAPPSPQPPPQAAPRSFSTTKDIDDALRGIETIELHDGTSEQERNQP
jgi:hypothetical protein